MPNNAPPVKQHFDNAASGPKKADPQIVTAAQLKQDREALNKPPAPAPPPPASVARTVQQQSRNELTARVNHHEKQLGAAKDKFERSFDRSSKGR